MQVLWERSPLAANDVVDALAAQRDWSPRTVKTMLNRLVKKGALGFEAQGKRYLYKPKVSREACVRREGRSFLSRVFGGALGPMLVHFVNEHPLRPDEIAELKKMLERKER